MKRDTAMTTAMSLNPKPYLAFMKRDTAMTTAMSAALLASSKKICVEEEEEEEEEERGEKGGEGGGGQGGGGGGERGGGGEIDRERGREGEKGLRIPARTGKNIRAGVTLSLR
jgi:hypothetical protein